MTQALRRDPMPAQEHTSRILRVVNGGLSTDADDLLASSWRRCVNDYHLHPDRPREPAVVSRVALEERRERMADLRAQATLDYPMLIVALRQVQAITSI